MQEKIPELVVPSLEDFEVESDTHFITISPVTYMYIHTAYANYSADPPPCCHIQLKPYVSHKTPYVSGKVVTAQDILDIAGHHTYYS